jgi:hypothetical protein
MLRIALCKLLKRELNLAEKGILRGMTFLEISVSIE